MAVTPGYLEFVLEQLEGLRPVTARRMFGGVGLYAGDVFFAILDNDTLFFKVDEKTAGAYRDAGMPLFRPDPDRPETSRGYYQVPARVLEDAGELVAWARRAVDVATSARTARPRRRRTARR